MNKIKNIYSKLEKNIGFKFKNYDLIHLAFIHKSYVNEHREEQIDDNERLEFLGDAVLELIATKHLFENYPDQDEGEMTSYRSALVKGKNLAEIAKELNLSDFLRLSKGEENSGGRQKNYILANTLEALIGAIYMDSGYSMAEKFIKKFIIAKLDQIIEQGLHIDSKSRFQELCQEIRESTPHYELITAAGPDHQKIFTMGAFIDDELIAQGQGTSKQKAENQAAQKALKKLKW